MLCDCSTVEYLDLFLRKFFRKYYFATNTNMNYENNIEKKTTMLILSRVRQLCHNADYIQESFETNGTIKKNLEMIIIWK